MRAKSLWSNLVKCTATDVCVKLGIEREISLQMLLMTFNTKYTRDGVYFLKRWYLHYVMVSQFSTLI